MKILTELKKTPQQSQSFTAGASYHCVVVVPLLQEVIAKDLIRKLDSLEAEPSVSCKDSCEARLHLKRLKSA